MRIALLIGSLQKGGSERVMVNLADYLTKAGHEVTLVTQYKAESEYEVTKEVKRIFSEITEEESSDNRILNFYRRFAKLRRIWKKVKPDVILSFIGKNNLMAIMTSSFLKIPVVVSVRGEPELEYDSRMLRGCARFLFRFAEGVVLQTERCLDFFPKSVKNKAVILDNPLNPAFLRPVIPYEDREPLITAVGRVDENKNHRLLIEAVSELFESGSDKNWKLVIYGEGELRASLQERVCELGLEKSVFLPGAVSDVPAHIENAAIFVLCSDSEGLPNTVMEAMALGIPVISSDCPSGGPARLIKNGENGFLFPPGDKEALKCCLKELMEHPERAQALSRKAAEIQTKCAPERVNRAWEEYLCSFYRK